MSGIYPVYKSCMICGRGRQIVRSCDVCFDCRGSGVRSCESCPKCNGSWKTECSRCNGTGELVRSCIKCGGDRWIKDIIPEQDCWNSDGEGRVLL